MAGFGSNSQRRSGFGGTGNRGVSAPQRTAPQSSGPSQGGGRGDKPRSSWTTASTLYDPYHSCMEVQIVSEWYRTALCVKLAPVFAERRGPDDGGTGKKYDHDSAAMVVLDLNEAIVFRHQLEAFINGALSEVLLARLETKRLILTPASTYYDASHPEAAAHANGMALAIEEDPTDKSDGKNVVFISRPQTVALADEGDPVVFYPELQALLAVVDSYIQNCARVDFGSVRLLDQKQAEERPAGPTATMPTRRTGGLGAPASRPAGGQPAAQAGVVEGNVSEADIGAALDSAADNAADALNDVLGDIPKF
jgi:hypothetical protein